MGSLKRRSRFIGLLLALSIPVAGGWAASAPRAERGATAGASGPKETAPTPIQAAADNRRVILLGPGDTVEFSVFGQDDMTTSAYIGDDGTLDLPLVGKVSVAGLSPVEGARRIEAALKKGGFLREPHVSLKVQESQSQRVSILGEVRSPARYAVEPNTTLLDLLALAGGLSENSASVIYIMRPGADGKVERISVDMTELNRQGEGAVLSSRVKGGDSVFVPKAEFFYIYGEVAAPQKYRVESGLTVLQAIAMAGGLTLRGSERRIEIKRLDANGSYQVLRAKPGDTVRADDVIRVKESIF